MRLCSRGSIYFLIFEMVEDEILFYMLIYVVIVVYLIIWCYKFKFD